MDSSTTVATPSRANQSARSARSAEVGPEGADLVGADAGDVVVGVDVDGRGVGVDDRQGRVGVLVLSATHGEGSVGWVCRAAASREGVRGRCSLPDGIAPPPR